MFLVSITETSNEDREEQTTLYAGGSAGTQPTNY